MAVFDWNKKIKQIPEDWRKTEGENVKIAVLDSGVDLNHPGLAHLDRDGRKFNAAQPGFDPTSASLVGKDDVADAVPLLRAHGTHCTSIIGARPVGDEGVKGIAPKADIYIIKIIDEAQESLLDYFINGMKAAIRENVDIVVISYFPLFRDPVDHDAIKEIFRQLEEKKILVVSTLENTSKLSRLNKLKFPSTEPVCIIQGVLRKRLLESFPTGGTFNEKIAFLFPETKVKYCTLYHSSQYIESKIWSSYVTSAMAGVIALLIAHWKEVEANDYRRRTRPEVLAELESITLPCNLSEMLDNPSLQFYKTQI